MYALAMLAAVAVVVVVGAFGATRVRDLDDYYVMGRNAGTLLIAGTFFATWLSVVTFVGEVGLGWEWGLPMTLWTYASLWGATLFALLIGVPLRRAKLLTAPDYFAERFGSRRMRSLATVCLLAGLSFYAVGQVTGAAVALEVGTGLPYQASVGLIAIGVTVYLALGGMVAVIWTDLVMFVVMTVAVALAVPFVLSAAGGWEALTTELPEKVPGIWAWNGPEGFPLAVCLGHALVWLGVTASAPHLMTRAYAARDEKTFLNGMLLGSIVAGPFLLAVIGMGTAARLALPDLASRDLVMPTLARELVPLPVGCLLFAGILLAATSTINTQVLTLAQALVKDIASDLLGLDLPLAKITSWTRLAVVAVGLTLGAVALARPATVYTIARWGGGVFACTYLPILLLSLYWRGTTERGAFWGGVTGLVLYTGLLTQVEWVIGMPAFASRYGLTANVWAAVANTAVVVGVSLATTRPAAEVAQAEVLMGRMFPPRSERVVATSAVDYALPVAAVVVPCLTMGAVGYALLG